MSESPFLTPPEYAQQIEGWREGVKLEEDNIRRIGRPAYVMERFADSIGFYDLNVIHGMDLVSFVGDVIERKNSTRKNPAMVLDLGGGMHLFSDQLRAEFGSKVKVISTGLSHNVAEKMRGNMVKKQYAIPHAGLIKTELHPDDSKMHSVFQLNKTDEEGKPKEEFDLITDTYGEQHYGLDGDIGKLEKYLYTIVAKLKPGGVATIFPFGNYAINLGDKIKESIYQPEGLKKIIEQLSEVCEIKRIKLENSFYTTLRITKK
ncbi:MAG: hypothetical protein WCV83_02200 [Candidatus Magasanikbacteria bacterium]|jgi:hypothetical protein